MQILYLLAGVEDGLTVFQIAQRMGLKTNTVYKFTRTMEAEKLLVRRYSPLRFTLGGAIHELATLHSGRQLLSFSANELIKAQGQFLSASFIIMELEGTRTYKRFYTDGHRLGITITCRDIPVEPYMKASTLLLLAYADPSLRELYYQDNHFEGRAEAYWGSLYRLECYLREVKRKGYCIPDMPNQHGLLFSVAAPIFSTGQEVKFVVGACLELSEKKSMQKRLVQRTVDAADTISKSIQDLADERVADQA
jgi:DNA-binding IclR family transcriptional regulator